MDLKKQILNALGLNKDEGVKLEYQNKLIDGTIIVSSADVLAEGSDISILAEDGTTMPLPAGVYEVEDGTKIEVVDEGIKKGIIWHTQGSGKTALAFYNVKYLTDYFTSKKIIPKIFRSR